MQKNILPGLRTTFWVHVVLGLIFGLGYLLVPDYVAGISGMTLQDAGPWRVVGAAICGFAASSWWAVHETEWDKVKIIVEAEIVWTVLATLVLAYGIVTMGYPVLTWISPILMAIFAIAFGYFYREQSAVKTAMAPR